MGAVYAAWPLGIPPHQWGVSACVGMSIGHRAVIQASKVLACTGLEMITNPGALAAVTDEFKHRTDGKPYKSLNEFDKPPECLMDSGERHHYDCCIHGAMEYLTKPSHLPKPPKAGLAADAASLPCEQAR